MTSTRGEETKTPEWLREIDEWLLRPRGLVLEEPPMRTVMIEQDLVAIKGGDVPAERVNWSTAGTSYIHVKPVLMAAVERAKERAKNREMEPLALPKAVGFHMQTKRGRTRSTVRRAWAPASQLATGDPLQHIRRFLDIDKDEELFLLDEKSKVKWYTLTQWLEIDAPGDSPLSRILIQAAFGYMRVFGSRYWFNRFYIRYLYNQ